MRIRLLLFSLGFIVMSGMPPGHAALGSAPRCLRPASPQGNTAGAKLPASELPPAIPNYDTDDRDYLIRTIAFEASNEPDEGKAAVAYVIINRQRSDSRGASIKDVVTRPWQFEPWMTKRQEIESLSTDDPRYQAAERIADAVLTGQMPDPTAGATHFLNPTIVRQRRGGSLPSWARGEGQSIGRHTFYLPEESAAMLASLSVTALGDSPRSEKSISCEDRLEEAVDQSKNMKHDG